MAFQGETEGDHYNCACPFCGKNNHYITDGVTLHLNQARIFSNCEVHPDMQSIKFIFYCPADNAKLDFDDCCPICGVEYDVS